MDFRHIVAALLTMSMFVMLGNMIKREHIDPLLLPVNVPVSLDIQNNVFNVKVSRLTGPWKGDVDATSRPCWKKFSATKNQREAAQGFVFFSLTNGPEYHALQVANAILIAKHLGAALVLPDIRGTKPSDKRTFGEVYDVKKFVTSLHDVVQVVKNQYSTYENEAGKQTVLVKVPTKITAEFITSSIRPVFKKTKEVGLASHYSSLTSTKAYETSDPFMITNPYACLGIFGSLKLKPELQEMVDMMVRTLQFLSLKSSRGKFISVDLRVEDFGTKMSCSQKNDTANSTKQHCFEVRQIGQWLKKIGFERDTTIYITQNGWHKSLQPLRKYYPNTFTKDSLMPSDMKARYLELKNFQYEKYIDFYLCAQSNVFVPTSLNSFYASVAGLRIALGNTQIIAPPTRSSSSTMSSSAAINYLSPYVLNKTHMAYSCLC